MNSYPIPPSQKNDIVLASGGVNPELAESVAQSIGLELADLTLKRHPNDELYGRFDESVRGKDVYIIQSHASANGYKIEEALLEHIFLVSAAAGASAKSVTAIAPYLAHSRGERKSMGREVVPAPLVIRFFEEAGAENMMSVDLHAQQTKENFRAGTYEHLTGQPELRREIKNFLGTEAIRNSVVVAPDAGAVKNNNRHAQELSEEDLDIEVIFMGKERARGDSSKLTRANEVNGVEGKICLIFDDMIDGGGTMATAAKGLKGSGAEAIYVGATHPIFSGKAVETLMQSEIDNIFVTDTVPVKNAKAEMGDRLQVVPIGPLIGRAVYEMVTGGSISSLFDDQNHR